MLLVAGKSSEQCELEMWCPEAETSVPDGGDRDGAGGAARYGVGRRRYRSPQMRSRLG